MAAALEFDPFNKISGEFISDLLNAILVLAKFVKGRVSINKCGEFSINTHNDDAVEPGRKRKGHNRAAGSAHRRKKKNKSKKGNRSKRRNSNVISEVERERRRRQSEADKSKFALLQQ
jgi:hypothetical protein